MIRSWQPSRRVLDLLLGLGAVLGASILVYATAIYGAGANQYGLHQFSAAEDLRHGEVPTMSRGEPYTIWPPLMPAFLAIGRSLGLDYPTAGLVIGAASTAVILFFSSKLLLRLFGSPAIALANVVVLMSMPDLLDGAVVIRNEGLLVAAIFAGLYALTLDLERPSPRRLAATTLLAAAASYQHYKGIVLVFVTGLLLSAYPAVLPFRVRWKRAAIFVTLALLPLIPWMMHNVRAENSWQGVRGYAQLPFAVQWMGFVNTFEMWLTRGTTIDEPRGILNVAAALLLGGLVLARLARPHDDFQRRALLVYLAFPFAYAGAILVYAATTSLDMLDRRLLLPVLPFLWGLLLIGFDEARQRLAGLAAWPRRALLALPLALLAADLSSSARETASIVEACRTSGPGGFAEPRWHRSSLLAWLRTNELEGEIYSNLPELVLFTMGRRATFADAEALVRFADQGTGGAWVVWFDHWGSKPSPVPDLTGHRRRLEVIVGLDEGAVYRLEAEP